MLATFATARWQHHGPNGGFLRESTLFTRTAGGARSAMHRMRLRFREALRAEIAQTVDTPQDLEDEMRYLLGLLAR